MSVSAFEAVLGGVWAITPGALEGLVELARREGLDREAAAALREQRAVSFAGGTPLEGTKTVTVKDGVATVPIHGPIFRRANLFTDVSGATSVEMLARDLAVAMDSPEVSAILLDVDSPGGEVTGIEELAGAIGQMKRRKPVHAYVGGLGASAAYWLASAADSITANRTAMLGSIGTVLALRKGDDDTVEFVSSQSPNKRPDLSTEGGRATVQALLDATADVFVSDVAANRGVPKRTVLEDFGRGGMLVGRDAVKAGLADATGTYEGLRRRLKSGKMPERKMAAGIYLEISGDEPERQAELAASEEPKMSEELKAELAAAQAEAAELKTKVEALEAHTKQLAEDLKAQSALAGIGQQALEDQALRARQNIAKVRTLSAAEQKGLEMMVSERDYAGLKATADEAFALVCREVPAKVSADLDAAVKEPAQKADLPESHRVHISALAKQLKVSEAEAEERYAAILRQRGGAVALPA